MRDADLVYALRHCSDRGYVTNFKQKFKQYPLLVNDGLIMATAEMYLVDYPPDDAVKRAIELTAKFAETRLPGIMMTKALCAAYDLKG